MSTVVNELQDVLKMEIKAKETTEAYAKRLALKANNMQDEDWQQLSEASQLWVNTSLDALERKQLVPLPEGLTATPKDAPPAKKGKEAPKKKVKVEGKPSGRGPKGKFAKTDKIKVVPKDNPFRANTKCFNWFAVIKNGMTVAEAVEAGAPRHHIRWAQTLGHITIG